MRKVQDMNGVEDDDVHYEGAGLIGSHTLCGLTDIVEADFEEVNKRVSCNACKAVRDHVLGRTK